MCVYIHTQTGPASYVAVGERYPTNYDALHIVQVTKVEEPSKYGGGVQPNQWAD